MPLYLFSNPSDENDIIEVIMSVHDLHEYIKDGIKWNRVFTKPNASIDSKIDPLDHRAGINKISNTRGTIGDMQDFSAEQSAKREEKLGSDPIKEQMYKKYKETRGKSHPQERAEKVKKLTKEVMIKFKSKLK